MRVVVQRCKKASVSVDNKLINNINQGLMILVGFTTSDTEKEIDYCIKKVANLRIFDDENGVMNKSVIDIQGEVLSISQFTLYGNPYNGNRPSYFNALKGDEAIKLYESFNEKLNILIPTKSGIFGADMQIDFINDGPVTIIVDTDEIISK